MSCPVCNGYPGCPVCSTESTIECRACDGAGYDEDGFTCEICAGMGYMDSDDEPDWDSIFEERRERDHESYSDLLDDEKDN